MATIPSTLNTGLSAEQVMEAFDNALTHVPGTSEPAMDGTGSAGSADTFSRSDHVHPTDTSRASAAAEAEDRAALVELVDGGAKNLLNTYSISDSDRYGITYTVNSDGSISNTAGTATQNSNVTADLTLPAGTYYLCGCPDGGNSEEPYNYNAVVLKTAGGTLCRVYNSTMTQSFTLTEDTALTWRFRVYSGQSIDATTFYPMICTKAAWDISHAYQPYRPSYQELYERVVALEQAQQ